MNAFRRFYIIALIGLATLSAYPLINAIRMTAISVSEGAIEPEQYTKYVIPYAAICTALLAFTVALPALLALKKPRFLGIGVGLGAAYGIFFVVERFLESIQIRVSEMTLVNPSTLGYLPGGEAPTVDIWQSALCIASPLTRERAWTYVSNDRYLYIAGDDSYKVHYYLIALFLITMVAGLLYGLARMIRAEAWSRAKALILRGSATAALVSMCIFANTTAFFRQTAPIQTPLAAALTGAFFVVLGTSVGSYVGSYTLARKRLWAFVLPVLVSVGTCMAMYVGEAVMMSGNLYRFGNGWFFEPLGSLVLAPVDILIVAGSGGLTALIAQQSRKRLSWPGKRTLIGVLAVSTAFAVLGTSLAWATPAVEPEPTCCYVTSEVLYMSPFSSVAPFGKTPYVYGFTGDLVPVFLVGNTTSGTVNRYTAERFHTPVGVDEFAGEEIPAFAKLPELETYKERYLLAEMTGEFGVRHKLYQMDNELWLSQLSGDRIWSVYRLQRTGKTSLNDLERALVVYEGNPQPAPAPPYWENQLNIADVFALARKGAALQLADFEPYVYHLVGEDFSTRLYEVVGADTVLVRANHDRLLAANLLSRRTLDHSATVPLRNGFAAVAEYLNPFHRFRNLEFEFDRATTEGDERALIWEDDFDAIRYYLNVDSAEEIVVVIGGKERLPLKQALAERRVTIEELVANGIGAIIAEPISNRLGGGFAVLAHQHTFELNDEAFYPSKTFMYVPGEGMADYYDVNELTEILTWYGYSAKAEQLRQVLDSTNLTAIARGEYVRGATLAKAGINVEVGWQYSSHTPVWFRIAG
ncbi:MAG: hypothetical protein FWG47_04285 [Propionibacteriaceae bacterium]|nr:hypothetical protein [Propionibacteriaceae bacterium]